MDGPLLVGVLGGVAAGKSAVGRALAAQGGDLVSADDLARDVLGLEDVRRELEERFGALIFDEQGSVVPTRLADATFGAGQEAVEALNRIMHPPILSRVEAAIAGAGPGDVLILDLPLLYETGLWERCQVLVFVDTPQALRERLASKRGWSEGEIVRRQAAQAPLEEKKRVANFSLKNDKGLDELANRAKMMWEEHIRPHLPPDRSP